MPPTASLPFAEAGGAAAAQTDRLPQRPLGVLVKVFPKLSETFVLEELLGLERRGMALRIYTLAPPSDGVVHEAVSRLRAPVHQIPSGWGPDALRMLGRHIMLAVTRPRRCVKAWRMAWSRGPEGRRNAWRAGWLAAQMAADGVPHLHTHFIAEPADVAELAAVMAGRSFSISAHAKDIYLSPRADLARKLRAARFTVTCTECNRGVLAAAQPGARVHRMYHGIDHAAFHPALRRPGQGVPLIVSVGRLRAKKGLDVLLHACHRLQAAGRAVQCEIVGYGQEQPALQALIDGLGLADSVRLVGKQDRQGVIDRYARAAVYVQPSRITADGDRDGIPNVLLEAMSMGLAVVATRVSGIPELVSDGHNGLLVEPDDAAALAGAIARLLDDAALGDRLGQRARETVVRRFDNDTNLGLVLGLLEETHGALTPAVLA